MRQIHLPCPRPLIAANRGLFPKSTIFGNASEKSYFYSRVSRAKALLRGYARGRFSQRPVGHRSLLPLLRRLVHENLATLRFSVNLRFYIIQIFQCASQNRHFGLAHPIYRILAKHLLARAKNTLFALAPNLAIPCLTQRVKRRHCCNMRVLKYADARGNPFGLPHKLTEICFVSSKQFS